jgi:hypothetical protein
VQGGLSVVGYIVVGLTSTPFLVQRRRAPTDITSEIRMTRK